MHKRNFIKTRPCFRRKTISKHTSVKSHGRTRLPGTFYSVLTSAISEMKLSSSVSHLAAVKLCYVRLSRSHKIITSHSFYEPVKISWSQIQCVYNSFFSSPRLSFTIFSLINYTASLFSCWEISYRLSYKIKISLIWF